MIIIFQGFFSLWKGFTPYYFRLGPHTVLTFIFLEQMNKAYKLHVLGIAENISKLRKIFQSFFPNKGIQGGSGGL